MAALSSSKTHDLSFVLLRIRKLFVNVIQSVSRKEVFGGTKLVLTKQCVAKHHG